MYHYSGPTPKKHYAFANSPHIGRLWRGRLVGWTKKPKEERERKSTTIRYVDKQGRARWKGSPLLRSSECLVV